MKKIILSFLILFTLGANAKSVKPDFKSVIKQMDIDNSSVSISIKDLNNGKVIYALNDKILMNPASVQKLLTTPASVDTLGDNFEFSTELYSRGDDSYILKLSADPYFTSSNLNSLIRNIPRTNKKFYIDDHVLDKKTWGEGWQWDDDMNISMPKFSSYNIDGNLIKLTIVPSKQGELATIVNPSKYPIVFFNDIKTGKKTSIEVNKDSNISNNAILLSGEIANSKEIFIPNNDLKRYFDFQLNRALEKNKIYMKEPIRNSKVNAEDKFVDKISHNISSATTDILVNSNNMVSETLFKLAGAKYQNNETGTTEAGLKMFEDYCIKKGLDTKKVQLTDASGVSKNNLTTADFISQFLYVNKNNKTLEKLAHPGIGTLSSRMLPLEGHLRAKTGTLSNVSAIAGFLNTKKGKDYAFCIMINDTQLSSSKKKNLEDFIIKEAYLKL